MNCQNGHYVDSNRPVNYCPQCGVPMNRAYPAPPPTAAGYSLTQAPPVSNRSLIPQASRFGHDGAPSLQAISQDLYLSLEELESGNVLWELFGKHLAAYRAKTHAKQLYTEQLNLQKEAYVRMRRQILDSEIARRQAEMDDLINWQRLGRQVRMITSFLDDVDQIFRAARFETIPDESKAEMIHSLYLRAEEAIFGSDTRNRINDRATIIDLDNV